MRLWCKFLRVALGIFMLGLFIIISCYGLGEDLLGWFPLWLSKLILGFVALVIGTIIAYIFALGIVKIKEFIKGD